MSVTEEQPAVAVMARLPVRLRGEAAAAGWKVLAASDYADGAAQP
jgi:hypothetical protein